MLCHTSFLSFMLPLLIGAAAGEFDTCLAGGAGPCEPSQGSKMMQVHSGKLQKLHMVPDTLQPVKPPITNIELGFKQKRLWKVGRSMRLLHDKQLSAHAAGCLKLALELLEKVNQHVLEDGDLDPNAPAEVMEWYRHSKPEDAEFDMSVDTWVKHHEAILSALEHYEATETPEAMAEKGCVMTTDVVDEIMGLPDTPEVGAAVQGDMMVDANDTALLQAVRQNQKFVSNLWEDKHNIRYCFGSSLTNVAQQAMVEAIQHFKNNIPCIGFKQVAVGNDTTKKCAEEPAIYIGSFSSGCFAHVGQPYKISSNPDAYTDSQLNLGNGCETMGVAAHELGHNLGMLHEQSRTDHGQYVKILWDNIREDKRHNYDTSEDGDRTMPYDMLSLMHYSDTAFGIVDADGTKLKTMEAVNSPNGSTVVMGNRMGLTHQDARQVGSMYGCLEEIDHFKLCTPDPEGCTMEDCGCHQEASALDEIIKTTDAQGCNRCLKMCPMHPYGTSGACGCPEGLEQGCFEIGGTQYCYCKGITTTTTTTTTTTITTTTITTTTISTTTAATTTEEGQSGQSDACKPDEAWWCENHVVAYGEAGSNCKPGWTINGLPILEACATKCGYCSASPPCFDEFSNCGDYTWACSRPEVTMGGISFPVACPMTCFGTCS